MDVSMILMAGVGSFKISFFTKVGDTNKIGFLESLSQAWKFLQNFIYSPVSLTRWFKCSASAVPNIPTWVAELVE